MISAINGNFSPKMRTFTSHPSFKSEDETASDNIEEQAEEVKGQIQEFAGKYTNPRFVAVAGIGAGAVGALAGYAAFKKSAPIVIKNIKQLWAGFVKFDLIQRAKKLLLDIGGKIKKQYTILRAKVKTDSNLDKGIKKLADYKSTIKDFLKKKGVTKEKAGKAVIELGALSTAAPAGMTAGNETMEHISGRSEEYED